MSLITIDWNPNETKLRYFAVSWLLGFGLVGFYLAWKLGCLVGSGRWSAPVALWILAGVVGMSGLLFPRIVRPVYLVWMKLTSPIGWLVSYGALGLIYFGAITPLALLFRLIDRDPMNRKFERSTRSYWVARTRTTSARRYFQQF